MELNIDPLIGETFEMKTPFGENEGVFRADAVVEPVDKFDEPSVKFIPVEGQDRPYKMVEKSNLGAMIQNDKIEEASPDPSRIHESRSEYSQKQDEARDARITTDVEKWASDPNSWDYPGVDTGPKFRDEFGDVDTESIIDQFR